MRLGPQNGGEGTCTFIFVLDASLPDTIGGSANHSPWVQSRFLVPPYLTSLNNFHYLQQHQELLWLP